MTTTISNAHQSYQQTQAETSSPGKLVLMMYDGTLRFLTAALEKGGVDEIEARYNVMRAQAIILELLACLDLKAGGEIARNLTHIYSHIFARLNQYDGGSEKAPLEEVFGMLRDLRETWAEADEVYRKQTLVAVPVQARDGDSRSVMAKQRNGKVVPHGIKMVSAPAL